MAFAETTDVEIRLGRELTAAEEAMAAQVIEAVTAQIVDSVGRDADWATALDPVPGILKTLCIEKVIAVGTNPNNLDSETETIGQHSRTRRFLTDGDFPDVLLTEAEHRLVSIAVYGSGSASSYPRGLPDRITDLREGRDVDEVEA